MKLKYLLYSLFALYLIPLIGCEKDPGEGGTATITGKIFVIDVNDETGVEQGRYYAQNRNVYIIYGEGTIPDDDVRTGFDGTYEFNYLHKGQYIVYAFTECDDSLPECPSGRMPVMDTIQVTQKGETYEIPKITVIE